MIIFNDLEHLADYTHAVWANWMRYFMEGRSEGRFQDSDYERWERQMKASYDELPEVERGSDRAVAKELAPDYAPYHVEDKDLRVWTGDQVEGMWRGYRHAILIEHKPTGALAYCDDFKSMHKNKAEALARLYSKIGAKYDG